MNRDYLKKAGKMIVAGFQENIPGEHARFCARDLCIGNWILFIRNISSLPQVCELNSEIRQMTLENNSMEPFISIDQEGGIVSRLHGDMNHYPGAMACAAAGPGHAAETAGITARHLARLGFNMNLAPVADINSNPLNPIVGPRSYGDTPEAVSQAILEVSSAILEAGVIPVVKHFPGHGDTAVDSHQDLPLLNFSREELENREMIPFRKAIDAAVPAVMVAHMNIPALEPSGLPASLSERIMEDLLRSSLGFHGLILTDCLEMKGIQAYYSTEDAVRKAVEAGADMIFISHTPQEQEKGVKAIYDDLVSGKISESRIDESINRMEMNRLKYCDTVRETLPLTSGWSREDLNRLEETSRRSVTLLKDTGFFKERPLEDSPRQLILHLRRPEQFIGENTVSGGEPVEILKRSFPLSTYWKLKPEEIERELRENPVKAGEWDRILIICSDLFRHEKAMDFVRSLLQTGTPCGVAVMRTPYEGGEFGDADAVLLCYEDTVPGYKSLTDFLTGKCSAEGICPVRIPGF